MSAVDSRDQCIIVGAGFTSVAHFKKWFKKVKLAIANFSLLQAFAFWNLLADQIAK